MLQYGSLTLTLTPTPTLALTLTLTLTPTPTKAGSMLQYGALLAPASEDSELCLTLALGLGLGLALGLALALALSYRNLHYGSLQSGLQAAGGRHGRHRSHKCEGQPLVDAPHPAAWSEGSG